MPNKAPTATSLQGPPPRRVSNLAETLSAGPSGPVCQPDSGSMFATR